MEIKRSDLQPSGKGSDAHRHSGTVDGKAADCALKNLVKRDELVIATKVHGKMSDDPNSSRAVTQGNPERDRQKSEAA